MKLSHLEPQTKEVEVVDDIICNQCGGSLRDKAKMNFEGLTEVTVTGGYASKLGDLTSYTFSLCEDCLESLFKRFKHPPQVRDHIIGEMMPEE